MIQNRYPGKCQSCSKKLAAGDGFAYKNGNRWFSVCDSSACLKCLGLGTQAEQESKVQRTLSVDGLVTMGYDALEPCSWPFAVQQGVQTVCALIVQRVWRVTIVSVISSDI